MAEHTHSGRADEETVGGTIDAEFRDDRDDDSVVGAIADRLPGDDEREPLDEDADEDSLDSGAADERAAREGTKGTSDGGS